jgi:hypothetical protein
MCNAWNHPPGCDCGWGGGDYGGGGGASTVSSSNIARAIKDAETYPTKCWWCGDTVFYHTNGFGDSVLFDSLGFPWRVHSCWENYWNEERLKRTDKKSNTVENSQILRSYYLGEKQSRRLLLAGAIQSINKEQNFVKEEDVASRLGISLKELREKYSDLYCHSGSLGKSRLIRMKVF